MLNVKPQNIVRIIELLKSFVNVEHNIILLIFVIPAVLMVAQAKHGRKRRYTGDLGVLPVEVTWARTWKEEYVNGAALTDPMSCLSAILVRNINIGFSRIEPEEA